MKPDFMCSQIKITAQKEIFCSFCFAFAQHSHVYSACSHHIQRIPTKHRCLQSGGRTAGWRIPRYVVDRTPLVSVFPAKNRSFARLHTPLPPTHSTTTYRFSGPQRGAAVAKPTELCDLAPNGGLLREIKLPFQNVTTAHQTGEEAINA